MTFYRHKECRACDAIEERLEDMVLAHTTVPVEEYEAVDAQVAEEETPVLIDESKAVRGEAAILDYVDELEAFQEDWYKYQSDVCYCD